MSNETIEVVTREVPPPEEEPRNVAALAIVEPTDALIRPAASVAAVEQAFRDYQALCASLLDENDVQIIARKTFRKKSAWRKLAVAFGVSCAIIDRTYERDEAGFIVRAEVVTRATAPNGRSMDGLGLCDLHEKCCDSSSCFKARYADHTCCNQKDAHDLMGHWSHAQHDIPATAATRATNRACADLFGMGEVSAEEIISAPGGAGYSDYDDAGQYDQTPAHAPAPAPRKAEPDWAGLGYMSLDAMRTALKQYTDRAASLTTEERDALKGMRAKAEIPWPPSVTDLATLSGWLDELEGPM